MPFTSKYTLPLPHSGSSPPTCMHGGSFVFCFAIKAGAEFTGLGRQGGLENGFLGLSYEPTYDDLYQFFAMRRTKK